MSKLNPETNPTKVKVYGHPLNVPELLNRIIGEKSKGQRNAKIMALATLHASNLPFRDWIHKLVKDLNKLAPAEIDPLTKKAIDLYSLTESGIEKVNNYFLKSYEMVRDAKTILLIEHITEHSLISVTFSEPFDKNLIEPLLKRIARLPPDRNAEVPKKTVMFSGPLTAAENIALCYIEARKQDFKSFVHKLESFKNNNEVFEKLVTLIAMDKKTFKANFAKPEQESTSPTPTATPTPQSKQGPE